jgi:hypothetical protein
VSGGVPGPGRGYRWQAVPARRSDMMLVRGNALAGTGTLPASCVCRLITPESTVTTLAARLAAVPITSATHGKPAGPTLGSPVR